MGKLLTGFTGLAAAVSISLLILAGGTGTVEADPPSPPDQDQEDAGQPDGGPTGEAEGLAIDLDVTIDGLTPDGLSVSLETGITNPTPLGFDMGDLTVTAQSGTGRTYLQQTVEGRSMEPNSTSTFAQTMVVPLDMVSERVLVMKVETTAGAFGVALPLNATITVRMPDIESLIKMPSIAMAVDSLQLSSSGLHASLRTSVSNPNPLSLEIGDVRMEFRDQFGRMIATGTMTGGSVAPESSGTFTGNMLMPFDILGGGPVQLAIETSAGVAGITLPIATTMTIEPPDIGSLVKTPAISMSVDIGQLSSDGLTMTLRTSIDNPNPLSLDIGGMQMVMRDRYGNILTASSMAGGTIAPDSSSTFTAGILIPLDILGEEAVAMTIDMSVGIAGITLPVAATVDVNVPDLDSLISVPTIVASVDVGQLTSSGLHTTLQMSISNPNPLSLDLGDTQMIMKGQYGNVISTSTMPGGSVAPNSSGTFTGDIVMPLAVLNEESIVLTVETSAGVAGIALPVGATVNVSMPDLTSVMKMPGIEVYAEPRLVFTLAGPELELRTTTTITNDNAIDLVIGDVQISVLDSDGTLVRRVTIPGGTVHASSTRSLTGTVTIGLGDLTQLIGSEHVKIEVQSEAGVGGMDDRIPFGATIIVPLGSPLGGDATSAFDRLMDLLGAAT